VVVDPKKVIKNMLYTLLSLEKFIFFLYALY
jgi:hypothetical protein